MNNKTNSKSSLQCQKAPLKKRHPADTENRAKYNTLLILNTECKNILKIQKKREHRNSQIIQMCCKRSYLVSFGKSFVVILLHFCIGEYIFEEMFLMCMRIAHLHVCVFLSRNALNFMGQNRNKNNAIFICKTLKQMQFSVQFFLFASATFSSSF